MRADGCRIDEMETEVEMEAHDTGDGVESENGSCEVGQVEAFVKRSEEAVGSCMVGDSEERPEGRLS
jgi:hypothetical protein